MAGMTPTAPHDSPMLASMMIWPRGWTTHLNSVRIMRVLAGKVWGPASVLPYVEQRRANEKGLTLWCVVWRACIHIYRCVHEHSTLLWRLGTWGVLLFLRRFYNLGLKPLLFYYYSAFPHYLGARCAYQRKAIQSSYLWPEATYV